MRPRRASLSVFKNPRDPVSKGSTGGQPKIPKPEVGRLMLSSRYAKPTQKQSNQDQYQSGPKKKPLTVNILIFTTTSKVKKAVKKSSSTTQTVCSGQMSALRPTTMPLMIMITAGMTSNRITRATGSSCSSPTTFQDDGSVSLMVLPLTACWILASLSLFWPTLETGFVTSAVALEEVISLSESELPALNGRTSSVFFLTTYGFSATPLPFGFLPVAGCRFSIVSMSLTASAHACGDNGEAGECTVRTFACSRRAVTLAMGWTGSSFFSVSSPLRRSLSAASFSNSDARKSSLSRMSESMLCCGK
mmetsp:Transcript_8047/g.19190  ORF Transcript_8047/g.19190 Transcript_8047/m.19190 type:complete len:305 (-) Transcript_8047:40-954(-)